MRTLKQRLKNLSKEHFSILKNYSKHSNSLYNSALYLCNEFFKQTGNYIGLKNLDKEMQNNFHYKELPSFNAQDIIRLVDKNFRSFFSLLNKKRRGEYQADIKSPKYRKKGDMYILIFNNQRISLNKDKKVLKLYKNLKLNFSFDLKGDIKQGIIKWNGSNFTLYLSYEEEKVEEKKDNKKYLGIDLGLNNLATCVTNVGLAFIVNGKPLKAYNQNYNKRKSSMQSELEIKNKVKSSKALRKLNEKRAFYVDNYMNQSVSYIVKEALKLEITTIVLGYNETWKQGINLGKKTNQSFTHIPHGMFRSKLVSLCEKVGIKVILTEESYTSKCSFLDGEYPRKYEEYKGKRVKRGLFRSSDGRMINADCNGAANIIAKVVSDIYKYMEEVEVSIVTPVVIDVFRDVYPNKLKYTV